jgi:cyanate permease
MRIKNKYIVTLVVLSSLTAICYGFYIMENNPQLANKCIGFGTAGIFLVAMPLFLIKESRGKNMKDYMLTEENLRKMQGKGPKKPENQ